MTPMRAEEPSHRGVHHCIRRVRDGLTLLSWCWRLQCETTKETNPGPCGYYGGERRECSCSMCTSRCQSCIMKTPWLLALSGFVSELCTSRERWMYEVRGRWTYDAKDDRRLVGWTGAMRAEVTNREVAPGLSAEAPQLQSVAGLVVQAGMVMSSLASPFRSPNSRCWSAARRPVNTVRAGEMGGQSEWTYQNAVGRRWAQT